MNSLFCHLLQVNHSRYMVEENSPFACSGNRSGNSHNHKKHASQSYADAIEESLMGLSLGGYKDESDSKDNMRDDRLNVKQLAARYPGSLIIVFLVTFTMTSSETLVNC